MTPKCHSPMLQLLSFVQIQVSPLSDCYGSRAAGFAHPDLPAQLFFKGRVESKISCKRRMACEHIFSILRPPFKQSYVSGPGHVPLLGSTVSCGKCKKCKKCSKRFGLSRRKWTSGDVGTFRHLKMDALLFC